MMLEFERVVRKRRMVRHFTRQPVTKSAVARILELAQHAPSAGFSQGSAYVVVTKREMKKILGEIQQGKFARQWISETKTGRRKYSKLLKADLTHSIEKVGAKLRARMPWLEAGKA